MELIKSFIEKSMQRFEELFKNNIYDVENFYLVYSLAVVILKIEDNTQPDFNHIEEINDLYFQLNTLEVNKDKLDLSNFRRKQILGEIYRHTITDMKVINQALLRFSTAVSKIEIESKLLDNNSDVVAIDSRYWHN